MAYGLLVQTVRDDGLEVELPNGPPLENRGIWIRQATVDIVVMCLGMRRSRSAVTNYPIASVRASRASVAAIWNGTSRSSNVTRS
jgi:hypothetical protein